MVKMRRLPEDDYMHTAEEAVNFNESRYYNWYDPAVGTGGWVRMGNRVNEGYAELTVCLYLPDGRVGFMFKRPKITTNEAHDSGGLKFEVVAPYERHRVTYSGKVCVLDDPRQMAEPREAFANNPHVECTIDLDLEAVGPAQGGEPEWEPGEQRPDLDPEKMFARGHTEQHMRSKGTVVVGDETFSITNGLGLRDHSWGPRYWQAPWYYRWLTANFGPNFGFMASRVARPEGPGTRGGFVWDGTALHYCDQVEITTGWRGEDSYHDTVSVTLRSGEEEWKAEGKVLSLIPLRNRRDEMLTRISEGMTRWTTQDQRVGYGLSEYLDQIIDGAPVGLAE